MKNRDNPIQPRILIVKLSSLGDLFHALPTVHNLKISLGATIEWVVQEEYVEVVSHFTDVDRVIPMSRHRFVRSLQRLTKDLGGRKYDYVVDLQGLMKSAIVSRLAPAGQRIGPSFHREGSRLFYSSIAGPRDRSRHAVEENLDVIRYLGLELLPPEFPVAFPPITLDQPAPRIALVPVSRWENKNWPASKFMEVAACLQEEVGAAIFLLGAPQDVEVCKQIESGLQEPVVNLAGRTGLVEAGSYLGAMDLVITNDSGPMHMAAAMGVPALALFGPTDPKRTGPFGDNHRVITTNLACQPCGLRTCSVEGQPCISDIKPDTVAAAALEMLHAAPVTEPGSK